MENIEYKIELFLDVMFLFLVISFIWIAGLILLYAYVSKVKPIIREWNQIRTERIRKMNQKPKNTNPRRHW
jgi:hypothetical protein